MQDEELRERLIRIVRVAEFKMLRLQIRIGVNKLTLNVFELLYGGLTQLIERACKALYIRPLS